MDAMLGQEPGSRQYFFGPELMVAPVTAPAHCVNASSSSSPAVAPCGLTPMDVYVPPGVWTELHSGRTIDGPTTISGEFHLLDVPVYARAGAVVPRRPFSAVTSGVGLAAHNYGAIEWSIHPGSTTGAGALYEDDGETYDYLKGNFSWTTTSYAHSSGSFRVNISAPNGSFTALPSSRAHTLRLINVGPPEAVKLGSGELLKWSRRGSSGSGSWSYDGAEMTLVVDLPEASTKKPITVDITLGAAAPHVDGLKGMIAAARRAKAALDLRRIAPGAHTPDAAGSPLSVLSGAGEYLGYLAGTDEAAFGNTIAAIPGLRTAALAELKSLETAASDPADKLRFDYAAQILEAAVH